MTQISREVEGQVPIPYKTSRIAPDNDTKRVIADKETQKGQAVEDKAVNRTKRVMTTQQKGSNIDITA